MSTCIFLECKEYFQEYAKIINKTQSMEQKSKNGKNQLQFQIRG